MCRPEDLQNLTFEQDEMVLAGFCLNKRTRLHRTGMCTEVLKRLATNNSSFVASFNSVVRRLETWTTLEVPGYVKGKADSTPDPAGMRALLPLCPFAQMCDFVLAARLQTVIDSALPEVKGIHFGAKRGKQAVEIPCAMQTACEKCQDY